MPTVTLLCTHACVYVWRCLRYRGPFSIERNFLAQLVGAEWTMKFAIYSRGTSIRGCPRVAFHFATRRWRIPIFSPRLVRFTPLRSIRAIVFVENFLVSVPYLSSECSIRRSNGELSQIKKSFVVNVLSHSQASNGNLDICLLELHPLSDYPIMHCVC